MQFVLLIAISWFYYIAYFVNSQGRLCPDDGWVNRNEKCYKIIYQPSMNATSVLEILKLCQAAGAQPIQVRSQDESDWILDHIRKEFKTEERSFRWILAGRVSENGGMWLSEGSNVQCAMNYSNWGPGEPSDRAIGAVFISSGDDVFPNGKWADNPLNFLSVSPVLCVKPAVGWIAGKVECTFVKEDSVIDKNGTEVTTDCIKIKKTTIMTILKSCACQ